MKNLIRPYLICNGCGNNISYGDNLIEGMVCVTPFYFHDHKCLDEFKLNINSTKDYDIEGNDYDDLPWRYNE